MTNDRTLDKLMFYLVSVATAFIYLMVILAMVFLFAEDKDPIIALLIYLIPAAISIVASLIIIRDNLENDKPREKGLLHLAIAHVPSVVGVIVSILYLFL